MTKPYYVNQATMSNFEIDFFELMFLAETVIPERPIARAVCFNDFSERRYHNMTDGERMQFYWHVINLPNFKMENEDCAHFAARFNPDNQFIVETEFAGVQDKLHCYRYKSKYHTARNRFVDEKYIKRVEKIRKK